MNRYQKLGVLGTMFFWSVLSPVLAVKIYHIFITIANNSSNLKIETISGSSHVVFTALGFVFALLIRPTALKSFFGPSRHQIIKQTIFLAIAGLTITIVLSYFLGFSRPPVTIFQVLSAGVFAAGLLAIGLVCARPAGKDYIGLVAAVAAIWLVIMPPIGSSGFGLPASAETLLGAVQSSQLTAIVMFLLAALIASAIGKRYFGGVTSITGQMVRAIFVVGVLHAVWILALTMLGTSSLVPRWLPLLSATIMLVPSAIAFGLRLFQGEGLMGPKGFLLSAARVGASDTLATVTQGRLASANKKAWIISFTGVSNEPRVLRQAEALEAAGWDVIVCGFDGHSPRPANWTFIRLPNAEPFKSTVHTLAQMVRQRIPALIRKKPTGTFGSALARLSHATNLWWKHIELELCRVAKERPDLKADLVIAHDYYTAPVGHAIARVYGSKFSVDVHEYAREQYSNDPAWVRDQQPIIIGVQDYYLRRADIVTVVCEGIANLIASETPLKAAPVVVRNVPFIQPMTAQKPGKSLKVLYHGDLSRPRQIHVLIESVPMWRPEFDLILRGSGDPAYIGDLKRRIASLGIGERVTFEPPVAFKDIVKAANSADIGILSYESYSPQIRFCLPNKIFEYIQAGLALCVSDLEEIGRIVKGYKVGRLIEAHNPQTIAKTINSFTREDLIVYKQASIEAAKELNWNRERERLMSAYLAIA